jgi:hypothetical protein
MIKVVRWLAIVAGCLLLAVPARAQDYRGRVQGIVVDTSGGALPGTTVVLHHDATNAQVERLTDATGHYIFDFVEPGVYTITAELQGFKKAEQKNVRVSQRGDVTVTLSLQLGAVEETVTVVAPPVSVQFNTSSSDITLERRLIDQAPISGRNPYNLATLDPTIVVSPATNENRPYHHAYANDYDAGGGTRRANDVLLDGVALGASFKTAYTPAVDAVEEITVSKNSVDAENGHSLGGIISLNMKSGTNELHGSGYVYLRDPSLNAISDPTLKRTPGQDTTALRGTELKMFGGTGGGPIRKDKIFSFTSYEQWDDKRPLTVVRTVPTELERSGDFSQSVLNGRVRTIYDPSSSVTNPATGRDVRTAFPNNVIPTSRLDPTALKMLADMPLPNLPGNIDNWQGSVYEKVDYWNFSQRFDVNFTDDWKMFIRYGQFKANLYQQNPTDAGFFPLSGSNRYGMSLAADAVWIMSNKTTLNVRGSYYNMTDEFYNPSLELGESGLAGYWPNNPWYSSLYNSGYVYYPALDVTSGTGTATTNRLGRQGREWYQRPNAWTASARMNRYEGRHNMKWGGEVRTYTGEAARFEPINLVFNSALTANSSVSSDIVNSGNQWASFMLGALDGQTTARLVPLQTPDLIGFAGYFQDDFQMNDRLTLNLGLRWEFEPGPTDPDYRLSQRIDLTQAIPEMQATPPVMPAQALALMASKNYTYIYNGAWVFTSKDNPHAWDTTWKNFFPRVGANYRLGDHSVLRLAYARYMMPISNVRDTLGDFVEQYAGYAQVTNTLGLATGAPRQVLANPYPVGVNPVIEGYGQAYGRYTNLGGAANLDQYQLRPQINDRFNLSYQREIWGRVIIDASYFYNYGTRVPYDKNLNMMDPAFRYEQKALLTTQVTNPFRNYLTVDKFPGQLRNSATVALSTLLVPYPQYTSLIQRNTDGRTSKAHTIELRAQRPFTKGISFLAAYAYNHEVRQEWFDDRAQYQVFQTNGKQGWEWRPATEINTGGTSNFTLGANPRHRITGAATWEIPIGKGRAVGTDMPTPLDWAVGGWQWSTSTRWYSGRLLMFATSYIVDKNPKLDSPTRDKWFDTSVFHVQDTYAVRTNPWYYDGLNGPSAFFTDMTLNKSFIFSTKYRMDLRIEAYNAFNQIVWDLPDLNLSSANFGKVTRKRIDSSGREFQVGVRFVF